MFIKEVDQEEGAVPGAVIAIRSFGDFLGYNPHAHILIADGSFYGSGMFKVAPRFDSKVLEEIFRHKVIYVSKNGKEKKEFEVPYQVRGRPGMAGGHVQS